MGIHSDLILGSITDKALVFGEGDIGWGRAVTLIIRNDFNTVILPNTNTSNNPQLFLPKLISDYLKGRISTYE